MTKIVKIGKTPQYSSFLYNINKAIESGYLNLDTELTAHISEKIHGTNAGFNVHDGEYWFNGRNQVITIEKDNVGCVAENSKPERLSAWKKIIDDLCVLNNIDTKENIVTIYFEWAGNGIMKRTCFGNEFDRKVSIIFPYFKITPLDEEQSAYWKSTNGMQNPPVDIYNITKIPNACYTFKFTPRTVQELKDFIENLIRKNEESSPVGNFFGVKDGILEGYVAHIMSGKTLLRFKLKGNKHKHGKVRKRKTTKSAEDIQSVMDIHVFVDENCNKAFLEQMFVEYFKLYSYNPIEPSMKHTGNFIKHCLNDLYTEYRVDIIQRGIEWRKYNGAISKKVVAFLKDAIVEYSESKLNNMENK